MFCDQTEVEFTSGKGGDGCVSFRREKYVPRGGPDGGNGGNGGDIILIADENINTLSEFYLKKHFWAEEGERGRGQKQTGKCGEDLTLKVPIGTMAFDIEKDVLLADLAKKGDQCTLLEGGLGGKGNANFTSSVRQAPSFAELGEPGKTKKARLELRLVADAGLIGLPSVGKSTLISRISNARPKIADYHFTTLIPNLGVVNLSEFGGGREDSFIAADIPGLIEGAHSGKGLGHEFLRHVLRTTVLVHILDATHEEVAKEYKVIKKELELYDRAFKKRKTLVVLNKIDAVTHEVLEKHLKQLKKIRIKDVYPISAVTGVGLKELLFDLYRLIQSEKANSEALKMPEDKNVYKVFRPHEEDPNYYTVLKVKEGFRILGKKIERICVMTNFENLEARHRVYDIMGKMGIDRELVKQGAKPGDMLFVGEQSFKFLG